MTLRTVSLAALAASLLVLAVPAWAGTVFENGPINGQNDAWTINLGYVVTDSFTVSTGNTTLNGVVFGVWLLPGDTLESIQLSITSQPNEGRVYFDEVVNPTASGCFLNQFNYNICTETVSFNGPSLIHGTYYLNLQSGVVTNGDPVYWDENDGVGCHSEGCPSFASEGSNEGSIPSEAFTVLGTTNGATTPDPGSLMLFASGVIVGGLVLRRKLL